jgi:hypothetical protein
MLGLKYCLVEKLCVYVCVSSYSLAGQHAQKIRVWVARERARDATFFLSAATAQFVVVYRFMYLCCCRVPSSLLLVVLVHRRARGDLEP